MYLVVIESVDFFDKDENVATKKHYLEEEKKPAPVAKVISKSKENRFLKFLIGGIFLIAVSIGAFSYFNLKEKKKSDVFFVKANDFKQKNMLDSAFHNLQKAYEIEPDNKMYKDNLDKLSLEIKNINEKQDNIDYLLDRIGTLEQKQHLLKRDSMLDDSLRSMGLRFVKYELVAVKGKLSFEKGDEKLAFDVLRPLTNIKNGERFVEKDTWVLLHSLYPTFEKSDSILKAKTQFCKNMIELSPQKTDSPF